MIMSTIRDGSLLRRLSPVLLAGFAVLALAGCSIFSPDESDEGGDGPPVVDFKRPVVNPDLPDEGRGQVIANLALSYVEMQYEEYEKLINDSYVFRVDPADINIVGQAELSAGEDLASTFAMFSGEEGKEPVFDDAGNWLRDDPVPAVQRIALTLTPESASSWSFASTGSTVKTSRSVRSTLCCPGERGRSRAAVSAAAMTSRGNSRARP